MKLAVQAVFVRYNTSLTSHCYLSAK